MKPKASGLQVTAACVLLEVSGLIVASPEVALAQADAKRPNVVVLMTDDMGWNDTGCYLGGAALGHPTPYIDRICHEGAMFTNWYGQATCTPGRAAFITGRQPIRTALSVLIVPGDQNHLTKQTPTIAEFFKKNGYSTYFSGKWHLGDTPDSYPIENGFDEMKQFAAYYPGVYSYENVTMHPWFPSYNVPFKTFYDSMINSGEYDGVAGQPAKRVATITYDYLADFDVRQSANAVQYIHAHAKDGKPFFMDVNFMHMHNPTNPAPAFRGRTHLGNYSDSVEELDDDIGQIMDVIRKEAPNTIVVVTADNGAWIDAYPDAGTQPFRGEKSTTFEGGFRVPGMIWWPGHVPERAVCDEMMTHIDLWATLAGLAGLTPPKPGASVDNNGKPIYFDSIDNSAYVLGKTKHSARRSFIYIDGETFGAMRVDVADDPANPDVNIAWKLEFNATDSWLAIPQPLGGTPALYNLTMDPYEKYDMIFNGAAPTAHNPSPGRFAGQDNGWVGTMFAPVLLAFNESITKFPNMVRRPGGGSNDLTPNLSDPANPVPKLKGLQIPKRPMPDSDGPPVDRKTSEGSRP